MALHQAGTALTGVVSVPVAVSVDVVVSVTLEVGGDILAVDPELPQDATDNAISDAIQSNLMCIRTCCLLTISV